MTSLLRTGLCWTLARGFFLMILLVTGMSVAAQQCPLTTTAASPLPAGFVQVIPHITTGAGFVTKFTVVNQSSNSNPIVFNDISRNGTVIDTRTCTLSPNGAVQIATPEANRFAPVEDHWALVGSQFPVGINLFFEFIQTPGGAVVNTVGFNDVPPKTSMTMPVELQAPGKVFGLALANVSNATNNVTINMFNTSGTQIGVTDNKTLGPFNKVAFELTAEPAFHSALPNGVFIGTIVITSSQPLSTIGVGDDNGPFYSVPALNPPNQALTVTIAPTDPDGGVIFSGSCVTRGVAAPGVTTASSIVISPASDPVANGLNFITWSAYADTNDHITALICHISRSTANATGPQVFNIRVLNTPQASATAQFILPAGTAIPAGDCITRSMALTGAKSNKVVSVHPAGDPSIGGLDQGVLWSGFSDATDQVKLVFCHFTGGIGSFLTTSTAQTFKISVID
jgi:hypothetical protein